MELNELYEIQGGLKARIGYTGEDKFEKMLLAMIVEFGECANDWRKFKYWSENQESKSTLLEEYVDGLHFVLEQGLDLEITVDEVLEKDVLTCLTIEKQFLSIIHTAAELFWKKKDGALINRYTSLVRQYIGLGYMLGFSDEQITVAYSDKNKVNFERQDNGY